MAKYRITIEEHAVYETDIIAKSKAAAIKAGEKLFLGPHGISVRNFTCEVTDREVDATLIQHGESK